MYCVMHILNMNVLPCHVTHHKYIYMIQNVVYNFGIYRVLILAHDYHLSFLALCVCVCGGGERLVNGCVWSVE